MSRYECGIHEPPYEVAEQIAKALKVPAAYFYCSDDRLAELMPIYFSASARKREAADARKIVIVRNPLRPSATEVSARHSALRCAALSQAPQMKCFPTCITPEKN